MAKHKSGGAPYVSGYGSLPSMTPKHHGSVINANEHAWHGLVGKQVKGDIGHYDRLHKMSHEAKPKEKPGIVHKAYSSSHKQIHSKKSGHGTNKKLHKIKM